MAAFPSSPVPSTGNTRPIPMPIRPSRSRIPVIVLLVLLALGAAWYLRPHRQQPAKSLTVPTVKARHGSITAMRRVAGSITAGRFANITVPIMQAPDTGRGLTLTSLAASGSRVRKGDLVAEIDAQDMRDHLDDVEDQVLQAGLDLQKRKTVQVAQMEAIRQRVRTTQADMLKAREDLKALDVLSSIQQEQAKLAEEEYTAAYKETVAEIPLLEQEQAADLSVANTAYEQMVRHRNRHRHDIAKTRIIAPIDGMVVVQTTTRNGELNQIQVGERVYSGQPILRVVDPGSMELSAAMSQTEAEVVRLGQAATLHFDAFPDIVLPGKVRAVGAMAYNPRRQNYYNRLIAVQITLGQSDPRVIPDLTASADITTSKPAEGVVVPREAVSESAGRHLVYVRQEGGFAARQVEVAGENNTEVALSGGLQDGEEIAAAAGLVIWP